jgi:hypothetical protein
MAKKQINAQMRLTADTRDFQTKIKDAGKKLEDLKDSGEKGFKGLTRASGALAGSIAVLGGTIAAAGRGFAQLRQDVERFQDLRIIGADPAEMRRVRLAELRAGREGAITPAAMELQKRIGEASRGEGEGLKHFQELGILERLKNAGPLEALAIVDAATRGLPNAQRIAALDKMGGGQLVEASPAIRQLQRQDRLTQMLGRTATLEEEAQSRLAQERLGEAEATGQDFWGMAGRFFTGATKQMQTSPFFGPPGPRQRIPLGQDGARLAEIKEEIREGNKLQAESNRIAREQNPRLNQ